MEQFRNCAAESIHTTDQIVAQAARLGLTVGITQGPGRRAVRGRDRAASARRGVALGQADGRRLVLDARGLVGPSACDGRRSVRQIRRHGGITVDLGRLNPPDICLIYATLGQMIIFINGLQWAGYKKFQWGVRRRIGVRGFVGPSAQDRRAEPVDPVLRRAPLRRRARRRIADGDSAALSAQDDRRIKRLAANGLRYPIPQYGIQQDARAGLSVSYSSKD